MSVEVILFWLFAVATVTSAALVVWAKNPINAAMALVGTFFFLAGIYVLLYAHTIAILQILVYAGAVMVLYVFVVAYVGGGGESAWEPIPGQRFLAPLLGIALFIELSVAVLSSSLRALGTEGPEVKAGFGDPAAIGTLLLEKFLLPFEASSLLLLLAAVGAIVLAHRRQETA